MEKELCKILGFEGLYEIYEDGSVFSLRKGRLLKPIENSCGYLMYRLTPHRGERASKHIHSKFFMAHRLVLIHFISPSPFERAECNHKDHDKMNNHYSNLEWVSHSDNILKSFREGGRKPPVSLGESRGPHSKETKKKMALAKEKPAWREGEDGVRVEYRSIQEAANSSGVDRRSVARSIYEKRKLRGGYCFGFIDVVKKEKELLGHPFVKQENITSDYIPIDRVPSLNLSTLSTTAKRIGRNLYVTNKGYIVRHYNGRELIERRFATKEDVLKAYGLEK